jgi:small GTP-binding protein
MADRQEEEELKIVVSGDRHVGKTSILTRYIRKEFSDDIIGTVGASFFLSKDLTIDDKLVKLQIWDTSGNERYRSLLPIYFRSVHCCILVYDVTNKESFENVIGWREFFLQSFTKDVQKLPIVIIGNKLDLENERQVSYERAQCWCDMNNMCYFETSAKDDINLDKLFHEVAKSAMAS